VKVIPVAARNFSVNIIPPSITVNESTLVTVNVTDADTGAPVEGATVNLSGCGVEMSNTTNASGIATFEVSATSTGNITVTVSKTGYNTWTKEDGIVVIKPIMITVNITTPPGNTSCTWFLINYTYTGDVVGFNVSTDNITWIPNDMNLSYKFTNLPNKVPTTLYVRATGATGQFAYDSITVTSYLGDINDNGKVDLPDLAILGAAYGTKRGEADFNEKADLNGDDEVGLPDLAMLGAHYGEVYW